MAKDPGKKKGKLSLKFFKHARAEEQKAADPEQPVVDAASGAAVAKQAETPSREGAEAETQVAPREEVESPGRSMGETLAPVLAVAARALVILAIVSASAIAAYFLVGKLIGPMMAEARLAEVKKEIGEITLQHGSVPEKESQGSQKKADTGHKSKGHKSGGHGQSAWSDISDLVVNPAETDGTRYVCATVSLEASSPNVAEEINRRESQIRDALIKILGKRTVTELSSLTVREQIREEIKDSVNDLLSSGEVEGVYFSNFVLQ